MSKVVKEPKKFKPVICRACGCVYEFEDGDDIDFYERPYFGGDKLSEGNVIVSMLLACPFCGYDNELCLSEE